MEKTQGAIENLGKLLQIPTPVRIESFDNSNIMGTSPVSAMVVFVNGKPSKKDYRKYKIKTVVGPDDYASMREVIRRRYSRVMRDGLTPPDLIVIDGGQGQVNVAKQVIQDELGLDIPIAGCKRMTSTRTHELFSVDPLQVIELSRTSQEFFLLQRIQDESTVSPSPSTASSDPRIPSPPSWTASKAWDQNESSCCEALQSR
mgnify:CR=1 FL=1